MTPSQGNIVTIGNFDGIHRGHRKLLAQLQNLAQLNGMQSVVLSYTDHPAFTLKSQPQPQVLTPASQKLKILKSLEIDHVELLTFSNDLAHTPAAIFLSEYLVPVWQPAILVMGYDSSFGYQREGNSTFLQQHASTYGYRVEYVEPELFEGHPISSSFIRELLTAGNIGLANRLLGTPYLLQGTIGHGISKGQSLGFPTANLIPGDPHQLVPQSGIYLCQVQVMGSQYFGLTNIGSSPTVKHSGLVEIETYILDFSSDIYGKQMELELLHYLREERLFANEQKLIEAIKKDLADARALIGSMQDAR